MAGDGGTSEEEPGEEDKEDERDGDGGEQPACVDIDGADLLPEGGERGDGGTSSKQERCTETTTAEARLETLEFDATAGKQLALRRGSGGLALSLGVEGGQVIDDAAGEGADDVLRDELDGGAGEGAKRSDGDNWGIAEAVAVQHLERLHDEAVGFVEALWFRERGGDSEFGDEACIGLGGAADPRECALGGVGGAAGEEASGAVELVGEFVEEQLVGAARMFGHGTHLG